MKRQRAETTSAKRRSKAEGKRPVVQHVTKNTTINNTINNYFPTAPPNPQPAPEPEGDACLFPKGERTHNGTTATTARRGDTRVAWVDDK
jgi:hypothetical protein